VVPSLLAQRIDGAMRSYTHAIVYDLRSKNRVELFSGIVRGSDCAANECHALGETRSDVPLVPIKKLHRLGEVQPRSVPPPSSSRVRSYRTIIWKIYIRTQSLNSWLGFTLVETREDTIRTRSGLTRNLSLRYALVGNWRRGIEHWISTSPATFKTRKAHLCTRI